MIHFEDLKEGDVFWSDEVLVDPDDMAAYNQKYDPWPIHVDEEFAKNSPFGGVIASGGYTISLMYQAGHMVYNNSSLQWAFLGGYDWTVKFPLPVRAGDRLRNKHSILKKTPSRKAGRGFVDGINEIFNQNDELVLSVEAKYILATHPATSGTDN